MVGRHSQRHSPLLSSVIVPCVSTMLLTWCTCSWIQANPRRFRLWLLGWRKQRWTRFYIPSCHTKKECLSKPRQAHNVDNPKRKLIVLAKDSTKAVDIHLPKQLKCSHCKRNNHAMENCFGLHPDKQPPSDRK